MSDIDIDPSFGGQLWIDNVENNLDGLQLDRFIEGEFTPDRPHTILHIATEDDLSEIQAIEHWVLDRTPTSMRGYMSKVIGVIAMSARSTVALQHMIQEGVPFSQAYPGSLHIDENRVSLFHFDANGHLVIDKALKLAKVRTMPFGSDENYAGDVVNRGRDWLGTLLSNSGLDETPGIIHTRRDRRGELIAPVHMVGNRPFKIEDAPYIEPIYGVEVPEPIMDFWAEHFMVAGLDPNVMKRKKWLIDENGKKFQSSKIVWPERVNDEAAFSYFVRIVPELEAAIAMVDADIIGSGFHKMIGKALAHAVTIAIDTKGLTLSNAYDLYDTHIDIPQKQLLRLIENPQEAPQPKTVIKPSFSSRITAQTSKLKPMHASPGILAIPKLTFKTKFAKL